MKPIYNFSPGPAMLPHAVMKQMQAELLDFQGTGLSVMEVSHRSALFEKIAQETEQNLRALLKIPKNYHVLFLSGGARSQFSMVPMNLLHGTADYIDTGLWGHLAIEEAKRYGDINVAARINYEGVATIPTPLNLNPKASYVHYTTNETVNGLEFHHIPDVGEVPLVADMSSDFLSRPVDISRFGLIYASAQKNIGFAGLTLVIIRDDLLQEPMLMTPSMFNYKKLAESHSLMNTPPTYNWYVTGLIVKWLQQQGGLETMEKINKRKVEKLYACIDRHDCYSNRIDPSCRSRMNVVFYLPDEAETVRFLSEAAERGLLNLKGHKRVGGIRASIYNAMPEAGVDALVSFMDAFAA